MMIFGSFNCIDLSAKSLVDNPVLILRLEYEWVSPVVRIPYYGTFMLHLC